MHPHPTKSRPNYYPFGSSLNTRSFSAGSGFRFGFNGKENQGELSVDGYDFGARIYDGRLGRWMSVDPEMGIIPYLTPYLAMNNNCISFIDNNGEKIFIHYLEPQRDNNGNFITGEDGNLVMISKYYEYGSGINLPNNQFVIETVKALNYICQSRLGNKEVQFAIKSRETITINELFGGTINDGPNATIFETNDINKDGEFTTDEILRKIDGTYFKWNYINWNPNSKAEIVNINSSGDLDGTGKTISAAIMLAHEIVHVNNAIKNANKTINLSSTKIDIYDDMEEKRTTRKERIMANQLGENKRYNHRGIILNSSTSTEHNNTKPTKSNHRGM